MLLSIICDSLLSSLTQQMLSSLLIFLWKELLGLLVLLLRRMNTVRTFIILTPHYIYFLNETLLTVQVVPGTNSSVKRPLETGSLGGGKHTSKANTSSSVNSLKFNSCITRSAFTVETRVRGVKTPKGKSASKKGNTIYTQFLPNLCFSYFHSKSIHVVCFKAPRQRRLPIRV